MNEVLAVEADDERRHEDAADAPTVSALRRRLFWSIGDLRLLRSPRTLASRSRENPARRTHAAACRRRSAKPISDVVRKTPRRLSPDDQSPSTIRRTAPRASEPGVRRTRSRSWRSSGDAHASLACGPHCSTLSSSSSISGVDGVRRGRGTPPRCRRPDAVARSLPAESSSRGRHPAQRRQVVRLACRRRASCAPSRAIPRRR